MRIKSKAGPRSKSDKPRAPRKPFPSLTPGKRVSVYIPGWHPVSANRIINAHWATAARLKAADRDVVAIHMPRDHRIDLDRPVRRIVQLVIHMAKGQRSPDDDNLRKSALDSLVHAGMLRNDSPKWVTCPPITYTRTGNETYGTTIILEDV